MDATRLPLILVLSTLLAPSALGQVTVTDTDDDATITLTTLTELSPGMTGWCEIEVTVLGQLVPLAAGDTVEVSLWEDDIVGDDLLFTLTHVVSVAEEGAQLVSLALDCSVDPSTIVDAGLSAEIYAEALVLKDACGTFCFQDNPMTAIVDVTVSDASPEFIRGDANGDGLFDIGDPITVLDHLFSGVPTSCLLALDANDDELVNIADAIFVLGALFSGGSLPAPPFPGCGPDPTPSSLDCTSFDACP